MDRENVVTRQKDSILRNADRVPIWLPHLTVSWRLDVLNRRLVLSISVWEHLGRVESERLPRSRQAVAGNEVGWAFHRLKPSVPEQYEGLLVVEPCFVGETAKANACSGHSPQGSARYTNMRAS